MTQVKKYKMGTYKLINGHYVLKNNNRTYRKKAKHIENNVKMKEARRELSVIFLGFLVMTTQITNSFDIRAEGVVADNLAVEVATPEVLDYSGIPYMEKIDPTVEEQIRQIAQEKGFEWVDYLVRLAKCENDTFNPKRINTKNNYPTNSIDRGIFMINDFWHKEVSDECAFDVRCATEWTIYRINAGYQNEWACNKIILNN